MEMNIGAQRLTTIATMKMAVINVPAAMYALCNPIGPFDTTALKLDSPNGRVFAAGSSDRISFELTTVSTTNSSEIRK